MDVKASGDLERYCSFGPPPASSTEEGEKLGGWADARPSGPELDSPPQMADLGHCEGAGSFGPPGWVWMGNSIGGFVLDEKLYVTSAR
jgi:hypothetical protein